MKTQGPINSKALIAYCHTDKAYQTALKLAEKLFKKDKRDYTGIAYFSHPTTVASLLLQTSPQSTVMVASALEDMLAFKRVKPETIKTMFGDTVFAMVEALTPVHHVNGTLDVESYGARLRAGGYPVQTVKLASLLDHSCSVPRNQVARAFKLFEEVEALLPYLQGGDAELLHRVAAVLRTARA